MSLELVDQNEPLSRIVMNAKKAALSALIFSDLEKLGAPVVDVKILNSESAGLYAVAVLNCSTKHALEYWSKIAENVQKYGVPVFVEWTGSTDVTPEELGKYMGRILAKMDVFPATGEPIDVEE